MEQAVANAMEEVVKRVNDRIVRKWAGQRRIKGKAYAKDPSVNVVADSKIELVLSYGGQKAWISEFGKGSLQTKKDNDWLESYKNSSNFNKARLHPLNNSTKPMSVVSREPNKTYRDIDGNTYIATNKFPQEGFNLEWWASRSKGKPYRKEFAPLPPLHTAHDQIEAAIPEFSGAANKAIKEWLKHNLLK